MTESRESRVSLEIREIREPLDCQESPDSREPRETSDPRDLSDLKVCSQLCFNLREPSTRGKRSTIIYSIRISRRKFKFTLTLFLIR